MLATKRQVKHKEKAFSVCYNYDNRTNSKGVEMMNPKDLKAEEVIDLIENLSNEERWKVLELMYDKYYNIPKQAEEEETEDDY